MASIDPSLIPAPEEQKWVHEISKIFNHQFEINVEIPGVSMFQVPETITAKKPEAYQPQKIGLGPNHHFRPLPYMKMEQKKLAAVQKFLQDKEIKDYKVVVFDKVRKLVPIVRLCYDMFLQGDDDALAWIFSIDGLFLLNHFHTYNSGMEEDMKIYLSLLKEKAEDYRNTNMDAYGDPEDKSEEMINSYTFLGPLLRKKEINVTSENRREYEQELELDHHKIERPKVGTKRRLLVQDIMMVENQIPFIVLKEIGEALHQSSGAFSPSLFRTFCKIHSPLILCQRSQAPSTVDHLLHYMYFSILNNVVEKPAEEEEKPADESQIQEESEDEAASDRSFGDIFIAPIKFLSKVPKDEIIEVYEKTLSILETFSQTKILIPSASKLINEKIGFKFKSLPKHEGIRNIYKDGNDIYLPCLTLNDDSEVILRNLVAYESLTANPDNFPLSEYMGLMCALIVNVDDVKYLRKQDIITGDLDDDKVAKIVIDMSNSILTMKTKEKSKLQKMIDDVNEVYNSRLVMKIYLLFKNLACSLVVILKAGGRFVESSWKIIAFMISIVTVFILTSQAYCDVYACDKTTVSLFPYASS